MRISEIDSPKVHYFQGNFAPVQEEHTNVPCVEVVGAIPEALKGSFLRIGANPVFVSSEDAYHPFQGDGMIHQVRFENGKAYYYNRFVETPGHLAEQEHGDIIWDGMNTDPELAARYEYSKNIANTHMVFHAGMFLALQETAYPFQVKLPNLDPVGEVNYNGKLVNPFSAHPKIDPRTGELIGNGYSVVQAPYCSVTVVDKHGKLNHTTTVDIPRPVMMHDCAISENYTIVLDLPCVFDFERMAQGKSMLHFDPDNGSRFGLLKRGEDGDKIKWFEVETCYCYHTVNAYEEGDWVIVDGCRSERNSIGDETPPAAGDRRDLPMLYQWRFNIRTGEVVEQAIDTEWGCEFARINENLMGERYRYSYAARIAGDTLESGFDGIIRYDMETGTSSHYAYGEGRLGGEPIFAPKPDAKNEEDGWVIGFVRDEKQNRSECIVIDAADFEAGPVARIVMPARVPFGFHSAWV